MADTAPGPASANAAENGLARVERVLSAAGWSSRTRHLSASARTAADAAQALGCPVGAIASSLVFVADGEPLLVLASGAHRVDTLRVAELVGATSVDRAPAKLVREVTGFAIGGVAPVGHLVPLRGLLDVTLRSYDVVWASAGHPHAVFSATFDELQALTGAAPADVAEA